MQTVMQSVVSASNDGAFHTTRSRSAVIKSSMTNVEGLRGGFAKEAEGISYCGK